ncbi:MAG: DUF4450 domain-containing protein [Williamsia sp.]|nr:DUF4450 domain-containing protein [Williamsia sp.]
MKRFINRVPGKTGFLLLVCLFAIAGNGFPQELYPVKLPGALWHDKELALRYKPDGKDFVITNGNRLFTRALYGTHTAFRIETGDRPEFALYMPGMGGNFKLGMGNGHSGKWLTQANQITARYRPGARLYTIKDSLLGRGQLQIDILALADAEGFVLKVRSEHLLNPIDLYWAFGGATGKKFSRDGDMGPDPESSFYLKPEYCKDNLYSIYGKGKFTLLYGAGLQAGPDGRYFTEDLNQPAKAAKEQELRGLFSPDAVLKIADANYLSSPVELYQSAAGKAPVIAGKMEFRTEKESYFAIYNPAVKDTIGYHQLPRLFQQAEAARQQLAGRIVVNTPDPFINTIGGALAVAADAIWEAPTYMHGSIGWRMRLNGWRGPYTADALGWHDRAQTHLNAYALSQLTSPPAGPVTPDTAMHLARSTEKLGTGMFTSGYISRDPNGVNLRPHHYDMNLVYIDELLRHFAWTGDTLLMRKTWPVIKRHLEWEMRNFDADKDNLFDAYAAIWASDALQYSGGDVTHTSAYNHYAFKRAAQIAAILGEDPAPYQQKAEQILQAMNQVLWMPQKGTFAEFKDALGNKLLHPAPALWTIYHSIDSEVPDPFQSYQMLHYVDKEIPHIPIRAKGLPDEGYYTLSTTNWMPYMWSLNNVALAESMHIILANWQAGRTDEAFRLFKSEVLQSMYLGGSPGNIVQISYFDAVRGEAYRDFADPIGMFSRALVEGLFGIVPDVLNKTLLIRPGLPAAWNRARFSTPDLSFDFKRTGKTDVYTLQPRFPAALQLKLQVIAQGQVQSILLNGKALPWKNRTDAVGRPVIEMDAPADSKYLLTITWKGAKPVLPSAEKIYVNGSTLGETFPGATVEKVFDAQKVLTGVKMAASGFTSTLRAADGDYTIFVQLRQGSLSWWMPLCFKVRKAIELVTSGNPEENSHAFRLRNNSPENLPATVQVNGYTARVQWGAEKTSEEINVPETELLPGTNKVIINDARGKTVTGQLINWNGKKQGKLEMVDMASLFNDKVTQIFKNKYLSPRPSSTTLQLPWQGIGDWPHPQETFEVDDGGLRRLAGEKNEIWLPQGIRFRTLGLAGADNILFTSQWDNYPHEKRIPISGKASHAWFLMAGSGNPMQSRLTNGAIQVAYTDGTVDTLALYNPETWWPIDQDYYTDGFAFSLKAPRPIRIHLGSGEIVSGEESKTKFNGKKISGGAATVLDLVLDPSKTLQNVTLRTEVNDVVIGLMAITLYRVD